MIAMVLCAGKGTRLENLTKVTPKVLLPIKEIPVIVYTLNRLRSCGVTDVVINLHYLGHQIQDYLGDGVNFRVHINYTFERHLLGTAGGLKNARRFFRNTFIVTFGDTLTNFNLQPMLEFHKMKKALVSIALAYSVNNKDHGLVSLNKSGSIREFIEKPLHNTAGFYSAGTFIFETTIFKYIPDGICDLGFDIFPKIIKQEMPIYGYILNQKYHVIDMGTPEGYERAKEVYGR